MTDLKEARRTGLEFATGNNPGVGTLILDMVAEIERLRAERETILTPRPIDDWHEDKGDALWWVFPVSEPPYCGTPLDSDWPGYHTHWTPLPPAFLVEHRATFSDKRTGGNT